MKNKDALIKAATNLKDSGYKFLLVFNNDEIVGTALDANAEDVVVVMLTKLHLQLAKLFVQDDLQLSLMYELSLAQKILALNSDITTEQLKEIKKKLDDIPDEVLIGVFNEKHDGVLQVLR